MSGARAAGFWGCRGVRGPIRTMAVHFVDELADAPVSVIERALEDSAHRFAEHVGAIIEYELYRRNNRPELPPLAKHSQSPTTGQISNLLDGCAPAQPNLSLQPMRVDAMIIPPDLGANVAWTAFVKRADATARNMGLADSVAAGLAGAIGELADNVVQHSETPSLGIAAFARGADRFEYVVADSGIGMLASLRRASEFRSLRDDLEALPLAVTPGVSRRGRGVGYGYGYRAVFLPLRAASGSIRLRSGAAVLQMVGLGLQPDQGRCSQRPFHQGVTVIVETCLPAATSA